MILGITLFLLSLLWLAIERLSQVGAGIYVGLFVSSILLIAVSGRRPKQRKRAKQKPLSAVHLEDIARWKASGKIVTVLENLSTGQYLTLHRYLGKKEVFGTYVLMTWTDRRGRIRTVKSGVGKVGLKAVKVIGDNGSGEAVFNVVMYRRDLAAQRKMRRPWREAFRAEVRKYSHTVDNDSVELPSWIG